MRRLFRLWRLGDG